MKKWIWAVLIFLVAGVVGGYAVSHYRAEQLQYNRNVTNGKTAIEQANYTVAKNYFSRALTMKKDDQHATNLLAQTKRYVRATSEFKRNEFTSARNDYKAVTSYEKASTTLKERSETKIKLIDKIKRNVKKFNKQLQTAKEMNAAWNFYGSNSEIDSLLSNKEFEKGYYKTIYDQVLVLQRFNNAGIVADQGSFSTDTTPDDNQSSASTSSNQQTFPQYGGPGPSVAPAPEQPVSEKSDIESSSKSTSESQEESSATESSSSSEKEDESSSSAAKVTASKAKDKSESKSKDKLKVTKDEEA